MSGVPPAALDRVRSRARRVLAIAGDRYVIDLPPDGRPEEMLRELTGAGATLVSINPLRETLEDVFVRRVAEVGDGARRVMNAVALCGRRGLPRIGSRQRLLQPCPFRACCSSAPRS